MRIKTGSSKAPQHGEGKEEDGEPREDHQGEKKRYVIYEE